MNKIRNMNLSEVKFIYIKLISFHQSYDNNLCADQQNRVKYEISKNLYVF